MKKPTKPHNAKRGYKKRKTRNTVTVDGCTDFKLGAVKRIQFNSDGCPQELVFKVIEVTCPRCRTVRIRKALTSFDSVMCYTCYADIPIQHLV